MLEGWDILALQLLRASRIGPVREGLSRGVALVLALVVAGTPVAAARAEGCPNEQIRAEQVYGSRLPDCRSYEQVSPTQKNLTDAAGEPGIVQASSSGDGVSFFAVAPFPGTAGSGGQVPTYLGFRGLDNDEWLTEGLLPEAAPGADDQVVGLSEDLARTIVLAEEPPLAPGAATGPGSRNAYVENNATGVYRLLAANVGSEKLSFADATPGGARILFETKTMLPTANAAPAAGATNLYEWSEATNRVRLAGVLPNNEAPKGGSVAGPGGPALPKYSSSTPGGSTDGFYTQNTISADGARVFFTELETGTIYMREPEAERTVQVSAGSEPVYWRAATPSGFFVFYTEGQDLYRFAVAGEARKPLTSGAVGVLGTLGVSNDGSYAYFVAKARLTSDRNGNGEEAETGADNLYEWHEDAATHTVTTTFVAKLLGTGSGSGDDKPDWRAYDKRASEGNGPSGGEKSSRVTPDGKSVLFSSVARLTSYDNHERIELYLYDAERPLSSDNPACVSCNPSGIPATSGAHLTDVNGDLTASPSPRNASLTRNLSADGSRVFFQTEEALVPGDTNGQLDVYEWEREGAGSCERTSASSSESDGGCLYLISTGQSSEPSYFGDASADGNDAFFFTRQSLVGQDRDLNMDVYDARVGGGIAAQNPPPPPEPCAGEACRGPSEAPPVLGAPFSATLTGEGNLTPPKPKPEPLARAQKLAKALKACRKRPRKKRGGCEARARKRYGKRATKTARRR